MSRRHGGGLSQLCGQGVSARLWGGMSTRIDAIGLLCPLPVLRLRKALLAARPGDVIEMETDDPVAVIDVPHFCAEGGHGCAALQEGPEARRLWRVTRG